MQEHKILNVESVITKHLQICTQKQNTYSHLRSSIGKCSKYVLLLFYKIIFNKILRFILLYQEFSITNLKKIHWKFLDLEGYEC